MKTAQVCACAVFFCRGKKREARNEKQEARNKKQEARIKSIENRGYEKNSIVWVVIDFNFRV